ncbi:hypothetical protein CUMW_105120 [Citrus unshiu]|nr:hypothetical protein CUMW_105120 [Citrus unshiu]
MTRQRNMSAAAAAAATKAEDTTMVEKINKSDVEKVEEDVEKGDESTPAVEESWLDWDELSLMLTREVVDEQMSWGYFSLPIWGVEAYGLFFSDVVWDDDIWNLKSIKDVPANP